MGLPGTFLASLDSCWLEVPLAGLDAFSLAWELQTALIIGSPTSELWAGLGIPDQSQGFPHVWLASSLLQFLPARFVSDHGQGGFQAVCQHRLMQAMVSGAARTFPPTQLEWTATQEKAGMALDVGCFNGELPSPASHCGAAEPGVRRSWVALL